MDQVTNLLQILLILLARTGMLLVHVNVIPSTDVNLIAIQHILSTTVSTFCYLCFGYRLSWIKNALDFSDGWIILNNNNEVDLISLLDGLRSMILFEGLISISIAGRAHFATDLMVSFTTSSFVQPIMTNLVTNGTSLNILGRGMLEFEDNTKTSVLHVFPAGFSFIASLIFGQRVVNIKNMDLSSVPINAHSTSFLGYIFIAIGFMINNSMLNNFFAFSTGMLTMFLIFMISRLDVDYWGSVWILQSGCAAVISNVQCLKPYETVIISFWTTILYAIVSRLVRSSLLEDYCNILAIHGIAGTIPLILIPICQNRTDFHKALIGGIFSLTIFSIGILFGLIILLPMKALGLLRSTSEQELYNEMWLRTKQKTKKRGIQPGEHTVMKFRKFMETEEGYNDARVSEI